MGVKATYTAIFLLGVSAALCAYDPPERMMAIRPTFEGQTERVLRYKPDNGDFVIRNGKELFNRPLYGGNTAFRVDAGDLPELSLYAPGQVGNVRFGVKSGEHFLWLHEAQEVIARYRPGAMLYEIRDPLLDGAALHLSVIGLYDVEGVIIRIRNENGTKPVRAFMVYGGAGGKKGKRGGDIGCESEPVSRFFQLKPENCKDNVFEIDENAFTLTSKTVAMRGTISPPTKLFTADAAKWNHLHDLVRSSGEPGKYPVLLATIDVPVKNSVYAAIERVSDKNQPVGSNELAALYERTEKQRQKIAEWVSVVTPDPFINASVGALCTAADAIWDEPQGSVMHGAVAWRSKYLGWRGPYANDAVGQHDRAKRHLTYWAGQQNTKPFADIPMGADPASNLSRSHPSKQTSGDIGGKHYDMNLVYIDALIRHLLWTGDLELANELWPVIERHMAWERRCFRRTCVPEQLPLYEAYAAIWASDDLQYHGGGVTHASAYNYFHNRMIAEIAARIGKDGSAYKQEADLILKGMRKCLWLEDRGWYGEWKDLLGMQAVHPSAALWTFYHTVDSEAADPLEAWQMSRFVDTQIAHIPVYGGDIPQGLYYTLPTTNWMPYTWSTNNVVMAEVAHTSLAYWQAGRPHKAFQLFKGCILDSMYMGLCPGNAGMTTYFDMARGEAQRDFGDAVGTCWRAVIEGLFGIKPNLLKSEVEIRPGFPKEWEYARINHPDLSLDYRKTEKSESYSIVPRFSKPVQIRLIVPAGGSRIKSVTVNGNDVQWSAVVSVGVPYIKITLTPAEKHDVAIQWEGAEILAVQMPAVVASGTPIQTAFAPARLEEIYDPQHILLLPDTKQDSFAAKIKGAAGHRTVFAKVQQDQMNWKLPLMFEVRPMYEIIASAEQPADSIRFRVRNNTPARIDTEASFMVGQKALKMPLEADACGESEDIILSSPEFPLLAGSNNVKIAIDVERAVEGIVTNWQIKSPKPAVLWHPVDLSGSFNDKVTQIFRNEYVSPRSPYCSLAIPKQGIGSWCDFEKTFDVDDSGLRKIALDNKGLFQMPQGIPFETAGDGAKPNILFVSQWDNYPDKAEILLEGKARHLYLLMAGSTNSMQSRFDNGEIVVRYADGETERLALHNPTTWWPINQDYFIDDYGFRRPEPIPPRVHLKTGEVHVVDPAAFKGKGGTTPGGAATVLDLPLDPGKELKSLSVRALANEVVIGLMSATLVR